MLGRLAKRRRHPILLAQFSLFIPRPQAAERHLCNPTLFDSLAENGE